MRTRKTVVLFLLACCFGWGSQGCSLIFFQRVPDDPEPASKEPTGSGRSLPVLDTSLAASAAAVSLAFLLGAVSGPRLCPEEGDLLPCLPMDPLFYLASGMFAVPALLFGTSAGFGYAWAGDTEAAWERHLAWRDEQARPPAEAPQPDAPIAQPGPAFDPPIEDVTCPPRTRAMGALPPVAWERFCAAVWPAGLVVRHGPARAWYPDGQVASEGLFLDGERHGRWTFFYPDGHKRLEAIYDRGQKVGRWKRWSRDGQALEGE